MDLRLSTAFHSQKDGQSEVTIRMLENFLHPHVWSKRLSIAEFAANNAINLSTGYTPFFLISGENPTLPEHLMISPGSTSNQAIKEAISRMKEALSNAKSNLAKAQEQMKRRVDKVRRTEEWAVGDRVLLNTRNLQMFAPHLPSKLKRRWVGLFTIANVVMCRGGQTFPKSTEIRNSVAFRAVFSVFFHPNFSVVAESVSEQLLQRTSGLGGQFWLSKESVSTSGTDCRIPTPSYTKYGLQKVRTSKIDGLYH